MAVSSTMRSVSHAWISGMKMILKSLANCQPRGVDFRQMRYVPGHPS
jgi:hypothetical protein